MQFERLEEIHPSGSHATPTVAADGERVVSFFGSAGLFCYDANGKLQWQIPLGPFKNDFGSGTSPLIVDDRVILCQDHDTDSFLMSIDKQTGRIVWRIDRGEFPRNYCTPAIWTVNGKKQIVVAATLRIVAYDFETGEEVWTVRGVAHRQHESTRGGRRQPVRGDLVALAPKRTTASTRRRSTRRCPSRTRTRTARSRRTSSATERPSSGSLRSTAIRAAKSRGKSMYDFLRSSYVLLFL